MDILVDNQVMDLTIIDPKSGMEWTHDLIGNADEFGDYDHEKGMHTMTEEAYAWWSDYIAVEQSLQDRIQAINESLDNDAREEFKQSLMDAGDADYEITQSQTTDVVESYEE